MKRIETYNHVKLFNSADKKEKTVVNSMQKYVQNRESAMTHYKYKWSFKCLFYGIVLPVFLTQFCILKGRPDFKQH